MPRRRQNIGRRTRRANQAANARSNENEEQRTQRQEADRTSHARSRQNEDAEASAARHAADQMRMRQNRANLADASHIEQNLNDRLRMQASRDSASLYRAAFQYNHQIDYCSHKSAVIGTMSKVCPHCKALKFKNEPQGLCCSIGKVKLPILNAPPEPLHTLVSRITPQSRHFLNNIRRYNSCFQMTSFGATKIISENFMPTFKVMCSYDATNAVTGDFVTNAFKENIISTLQIQGQIYHRAGSLLPLPDSDHQFLQIYFIGNTDDEVNRRCAINPITKREIVQPLQSLFHQHNDLIRLFKTAIEQMPSDTHKVVIRADKAPVDEHARRYNAPTINEIAIVIVGDQFESRDIVLHRRNDRLQRVSETHRSYDALQYPILFWQGEDGYHFNIKMINPTNGNDMQSYMFCICGKKTTYFSIIKIVNSLIHR